MFEQPFMMDYTSMNRNTSDWSDNFSTDNTSKTGTSITVTGGVLVWDADRLDDAASIDALGTTISETAWVNKFKFVISNLTLNAGGQEIIVCVGFTDSDHSERGETGQDGIVLWLDMYGPSTKKWGIGEAENQCLGARGGCMFTHGGYTDLTTTLATGTYYVKLRRTSATLAKLALYSDASYSTLTEEISIVITSGLNALRYWKVFQFNGTDSGVHTLNGNIDDAFLYNGVTDA